MSDDAASARRFAYLAAKDIGGDLASEIVKSAERAVMRQLLCRLLPDGEAGYWRLVEQEVSK